MQGLGVWGAQGWRGWGRAPGSEKQRCYRQEEHLPGPGPPAGRGHGFDSDQVHLIQRLVASIFHAS